MNKCMTTEDGFCSKCGAILPLPVDSMQSYITCICKSRIPCSEFNNMIVAKADIILNEIRGKSTKKKARDDKSSGPKLERLCGHCGHNEMTYKTQQTRSADEGMTIFYYCLKCGSLEKEDS
ncbi:DNA-directed RNA polymerase I subunit RPA12-like [Styela clava]|uniref:DNA-directed RNA polymerase I subunit RPA12-like n=1 Tax=Styela clava TaxID=7725 RepID=UPI001939C178|nr:DNA-directed RNA polymerase I subunit RPA12-like [Styela clava]